MPAKRAKTENNGDVKSLNDEAKQEEKAEKEVQQPNVENVVHGAAHHPNRVYVHAPRTEEKKQAAATCTPFDEHVTPQHREVARSSLALLADANVMNAESLSAPFSALVSQHPNPVALLGTILCDAGMLKNLRLLLGKWVIGPKAREKLAAQFRRAYHDDHTIDNAKIEELLSALWNKHRLYVDKNALMGNMAANKWAHAVDVIVNVRQY